MNRTINKIVEHCSATKEGKHYDAHDIRRWHIKRGFRTIGYHYVILLDGTIQIGRPEWQMGAHVRGQNSNSIGICYIGGLDKYGKPKDTRTEAQKKALNQLRKDLQTRYPHAKGYGHRDLSPDRNGNGVIEKHEWLKACPCYNAKEEYENL